jgi:hypothetical protein
MKRPPGISRLARSTDGEVVDFAQRQVFSPGEKIGPVPSRLARRGAISSG